MPLRSLFLLSLASCPSAFPAGPPRQGLGVQATGVERPEDPSEVARRAAADRGAKERLLRAFAEQGIEVDPDAGRIEFEGALNNPRMPIEYLVTGPRGATHECLFVTKAKPSLLAAAVHLLGLERGRNVEYREKDPPPTEEELKAGVSPYETVPPRGDGLYVYVEWREEDEVRQYRGEDLITNARTGRTIPRQRWVFLGSRFVRPTRNDPEVFAADVEENLVAVNYFALGNQILTYPHPDAAVQNVFYPNEALLPEPGRVVRILLSRQRLERPFAEPRKP